MSDQQFCLKWNNYSTSVSAVFRELLEKEQMCDVTLATKVNAPYSIQAMNPVWPGLELVY